MADLAKWALGRIAECAPESGPDRATSKINDLVAAWIFFDGRSSQLFGMVADPSTIDGRDSIKAACETALRGWFEVLRESDPAGHVEIYRALTAKGGFQDLPEPETIRTERALVEERQRRFEELGPPSDTLVDHPEVLAGLERFRALEGRASFDLLEDVPPLDSTLLVADFGEVVPDDWANIAACGLPPDFYPLAEDVGGNYIGVLLDADLLTAGSAPLVVYFHENDPAYEWIFESAGAAADALAAVANGSLWTDALRGTRIDAVNAALAELNDVVHERATTPAREASRRSFLGNDVEGDADRRVYESAGNRFAARNVLAQRIWREYAERLRKNAQ